MKRIDGYWYSQNPVAWLLLPVSWLYCTIVLIRRLLYHTGFLRTHHFPVPVIVVGNINVGGTGKTPLLIALCDILKEKGYRPGIVSRGYGGDVRGEKLVETNDTASLVGDEPLLIARRSNCPVSVGADRVAAARLLLKHHQCDVLLSDDGLQHYRMHRDYEIAVIDAKRLMGNGFCLPAGPLREPPGRLNSVDIQVFNGGSDKELGFILKLGDAINLSTGEAKLIETFCNLPIHVIAGIGCPERFFDHLSVLGLTFTQHAFPDHHRFNENDFSFAKGQVILMTEKDAVKCDDLNLENAWYIPAETVLSSMLYAKLNKDFDSVISKLSVDE